MIKVQELSGAELDYYVALAEGLKEPKIHPWYDRSYCSLYGLDNSVYNPSNDWGTGGH